MRLGILTLLIFGLFACTTDVEPKNDIAPQEEIEDTAAIQKDSLVNNELPTELTEATVENTEFTTEGFKDKKYYELLFETHLCDPDYDASSDEQTTPCSAKLFKFFPYNNKRKIEDAFLLQVKAGVNDFPYRRLLIFIREDGKLVLMNGIIGYLVKRIPQDNGIDDLIVAVIDDLGNDKFDRYDVLLKYKDGKYHYEEAIGDLEGVFKDPELKQRATKAIRERINEKELIF